MAYVHLLIVIVNNLVFIEIVILLVFFCRASIQETITISLPPFFLAEFQSVLAFRQHHHLPMAFDQSDLYFICRMKPFSFDISPCTDELLKCEWLPVRELQLSPLATQLTNRIAQMVLKGLREGFEQFDISCEEWPSLLPGHTYNLFLKRTENSE